MKSKVRGSKIGLWREGSGSSLKSKVRGFIDRQSRMRDQFVDRWVRRSAKSKSKSKSKALSLSLSLCT